MSSPSSLRGETPLRIRLFAEAIVDPTALGLVQEFFGFLPAKANCGFCMAAAVDGREY